MLIIANCNCHQLVSSVSRAARHQLRVVLLEWMSEALLVSMPNPVPFLRAVLVLDLLQSRAKPCQNHMCMCHRCKTHLEAGSPA